MNGSELGIQPLFLSPQQVFLNKKGEKRNHGITAAQTLFKVGKYL